MSMLTALGDKVLSHVAPRQAAHAASSGAQGCWIESRVCDPHCPFWYWKEIFYWRCDDGYRYTTETGCTDADNC
ncbi:hypothetical protein ACIQNU_02840 [Streptomyces sp. NPDC091292]|uniref:hypothetical protein n=1 Tax=Streptomyces sp. NPDC091292 TaxID=3365991 RepID=UPI0037FBEA94